MKNQIIQFAARSRVLLQRLVRLIRYLYQNARAEYWKFRLKQRLRKRGFEWLDAALKRQGYTREDTPDGATIYRHEKLNATWTIS
jgi:hypothetical protein